MKLVASWLFAALVVTVTGVRRANAEPPPIVRVFVAGSPDAVSGMRDALQDQCARPNLAVMVQDAASADAELLDTAHSAGLADAYVDLRPDNDTRVVVVDGQTHEQLERRTLGHESSLELSIESVAQVVCSAIDSTLAARAAAATPIVPPAPAPPPAPPPPAQPAPIPLLPAPAAQPPDRVSSAWVGVFGVGSDYGAGLHLGGGAVAGASFGSSQLRFGGSVLVEGFPSLGLERQGAQASLDLYGVRLLPTLEWDANPQLGIFAGLGIGADWLRVFAGSPPAGGVARSDTGSVEPILSSLVGGKLALGLHVSAWLALGADLDLARHPYINQASGAPTLFFESPRARPVGLAGLAVSFEREEGLGTANTSTGSP